MRNKNMVGDIISFASGFVTGCLYTSYRFQKNPNDLIKMAKILVERTK